MSGLNYKTTILANQDHKLQSWGMLQTEAYLMIVIYDCKTFIGQVTGVIYMLDFAIHFLIMWVYLGLWKYN